VFYNSGVVKNKHRLLESRRFTFVEYLWNDFWVSELGKNLVEKPKDLCFEGTKVRSPGDIKENGI
jgi:hypothetical protein